VSIDTARRTSASLRSEGGTGLIAIRTYGGAGRVYLGRDGVHEVRSGSLLLSAWEPLMRYHCHGKRWDFWWFEFDTLGPSDVPVGNVLEVPVEKDEVRRFGNVQRGLRVQDAAQRRWACAEFQALLYRWLAHGTVPSRHPEAYAAIQRVIAEMQDHLDGSLSVPQMATMADMSESNFRRRFHQVTGMSPKRFHGRLRLTWADHMLRSARMTVSEVAYQLGFSSPFHFSRAFRDFYGHPPSQHRGES
jgi:AraC-like DNA-binding protein